jgi:hypothetical protein
MRACGLQPGRASPTAISWLPATGGPMLRHPAPRLGLYIGSSLAEIYRKYIYKNLHKSSINPLSAFDTKIHMDTSQRMAAAVMYYVDCDKPSLPLLGQHIYTIVKWIGGLNSGTSLPPPQAGDLSTTLRSHKRCQVVNQEEPKRNKPPKKKKISGAFQHAPRKF